MSFFSSESSHDPSGVKCRPSDLNPATITCRHGAVLTAHSGSHDAGAALFEDYNLRAAVQLERLTRYKCDGREHPDLAIDEVMSIASKTRKMSAASAQPYRISHDFFYKNIRGVYWIVRNIANILKSAHVVTCCASFCVRTQRALMTSSESTSSGRRAAFATTQKSFLQSPRSACFRAAVLQ
jgi:predicted NodU family carbamoyl transferase